MSVTNGVTTRIAFHPFKDISDDLARYGFNTTKTRDELCAEVIAGMAQHPTFLRISHAGMMGWLQSINASVIQTMTAIHMVRSALERIEDHLAKKADDAGDPVADAFLGIYCGQGKAVMDQIDSFEVASRLGLSIRALKAIRNSGCKTPRELAAYGGGRLLGLKGCGTSTMWEIHDALKEHYNLDLAD